MLLLLLAVAAAQAPTCLPYWTRCQAVCSPSINGSVVDPFACPPALDSAGQLRPRCDVCPFGRTCRGGQCLLPPAMLGQPCGQDAECETLFPDVTTPLLSCQAGQCALAPGRAELGDPCAATADCAGTLTCQAGVCGSVGACLRNADCPADEQCLQGTNACVGVTYSGPCGAAGDAACPQSQICNRAVSQCRATFTLDAGADCSDVRARRYGCAPGTVCADLGGGVFQCTPTGSPPGAGECNALLTDSCSSTYDCACNATSTRGSCIPATPDTACSVAWRSLQSCAEANGCRSDVRRAPPGSCLADACPGQFYGLALCLDGLAADFFADGCNQASRVGVSLGLATPPVEAAAAALPNLF